MADCIFNPSNRRGVGLLRQGAAALLGAGVCLAAAADHAAAAKVKNVRFWSLGEVTRIAIEVSADFNYRQDRLPDPDRIFFDIPARPETTDRKIVVIPVGDSLLKQIRLAETQPGVTRVVLDVEAHDPPVQFTASQLSSPSRLIVELRINGLRPRLEVARIEERGASAELPAPVPAQIPAKAVHVAAEGAVEVAARAAVQPLAKAAVEPPAKVAVEPPAKAAAEPEVKATPRRFVPPAEQATVTPAPPPVLAPLVTSVGQAPARGSLPAMLPKLNLPGPPGAIAPDVKPRVSVPADSKALPAKRATNGEESLTRVLGLKLGRVVIDPGHGGHDEGTRGPTGLTEKEVVLDIAKRLGDLLQQHLGTEVVYTREDDTFIPLEERTHIANDHRADLFLSIHANSSPVRSVSGVESYYLNFTTSKTALELAARENASAQSSIFDLQQVLEKIAVRDKIDESREFAGRIQTALFAASAKGNPAVKNRGIKQAPFVVLIGASMPSVLAEIGFLTNLSDESLLRNPAHRQKIAEALYKGTASYADTLSHFAVARRE